ncbi:MAG: heavy metal translocating P-type ATPase [Clostridia bacterium]
MKNNRKRLIRLIIAAIGLVVVLILVRFISVNWWVEAIMLGVVYLYIGYDILYKAGRNIFHGQIFDENFLMCIASIGAFIAGQYTEAVAVMLFYQVGEYFQNYAVNKSRKQISELMDIKPERALVIRNGNEIVVDPSDVKIGENIIVRRGEKIATDGVVVSGVGSLDVSKLTGESLPLDVSIGDNVLSGSINVGGVLTIEAKKEYFDSTVSKILELVESASGKKAQAEKFITKFSRYYTPIVVILAILLAIVPSLITNQWNIWIMRALTFLVVSCPCALVISVPLSFFGGIGGASKQGILIKGGNYLELIGKVNIFVFDKTGTLTKGDFEVQSIFPKEDKDNILKKAYIAENGSLHPIALTIVNAAKNVFGESLQNITVGYKITEIAGKGIKAENNENMILCGNKKLMKEFNILFEECKCAGSVIYVAENGKYLGCIFVADKIKSEAANVIKKLKESGAKIVMMTGDNKLSAENIANSIGIDNVKAELLPADKVEYLENIIKNKKQKDVVAFVGDGINDAPVLMRADIGISMGGVGSDSAIEASDMVLMYDDLSAILTAKVISKKTLSIVKQNIIFALAIKIIVLILSAFGYANMWLAVFADVGVSVLAILNAMRCLTIKNKENKI